MVAGLQDHDVVIGDVVDESVSVIDSTRPSAGENVLEWLGFADTRKRIEDRVGDEVVDALEGLAILALPMDVVLPPVRIEGDPPRHASRRSCCSNSPRRTRSMAASNRSAFAGFRSR